MSGEFKRVTVYSEDEVAEIAKKIMAKMSWQQRLNFIEKLLEGYCRHCGCDDPGGRCQCENNE